MQSPDARKYALDGEHESLNDLLNAHSALVQTPPQFLGFCLLGTNRSGHPPGHTFFRWEIRHLESVRVCWLFHTG